MKKIILCLISIIFILCLSSCKPKFADLNITMVDNKYIMSNSVIVVNTNHIFAKVLDEDNRVRLIRISGYDPEYYTRDFPGSTVENPMRYMFIDLPDEIIDFEFIGMFVIDQLDTHMYIKSSDGKIYDVYIYSGGMSIRSLTAVTEMDMNWDFNETIIGNYYDSSCDFHQNGYFIFRDQEVRVIIDENNDIYFDIDGNSTLLLNDFPIRNLFFNIYKNDLGIVLIGNNNEVYLFNYYNETKTISGNNCKFDEKIINYGSINGPYAYSEYTYIVTESYIYLLDRNLENVKTVEINNGLYGIGRRYFSYREDYLYHRFYLGLYYKNEDGTLRVEVIEIT